MTYRALQTRSAPREAMVASFMALKGKNLRDLPQFLSTDFALSIKNYRITKDGRLKKRKGLLKLFEVAGTDSITMLRKFTSDIYIFGYADKISAYDKTTGTVTNIKTFTSESTYEGDRAGDYFMVTNKLDPIGRISRTLAYNTQTANFTVGKKLTGATSGATAIILQDSDSGATGTLTLGSVTGTFQNGEIITDDNSSPGSATVNGTLTWVYTEISGAPVCDTLKVIGKRCFAGNIKGDSSAVQYSTVDTGANPPFNTWTTSTLSDGGGKVYNRNAGDVLAIEPFYNDIVVVRAVNGKWAFTIDALDVGGSLSKVDTPTVSRLDEGGTRGSISTPKGIFYADKSGLWQIVSLGQDNVPFSEQEFNITQLLGEEYFKDVNFDNADFVYDGENNIIYCTLAKNSSVNNLVIAYNIDNKSVVDITGWNINRFMNDNGVIYGCSANSTKVWQCFEGYSDDGTDIWTEYVQEIKLGELHTRQGLIGEYIQGFLSTDTSLRVQFDKYDNSEVFKENVLAFTWTPENSNSGSNGYGKVSYGQAGYGGNSNVNDGMIECFDGARGKISNFHRLQIKITGNDKLPHEISWFSLLARPKAPIRTRKLVQIT